MAEPCLHCMIQKAIAAHAAQARPRLEDGSIAVVAPEVLAALAAVAADIIASGAGQDDQTAAFTFLMERLAKQLNARGVPTTVTLDPSTGPAAEVLH